MDPSKDIRNYFSAVKSHIPSSSTSRDALKKPTPTSAPKAFPLKKPVSKISQKHNNEKPNTPAVTKGFSVPPRTTPGRKNVSKPVEAAKAPLQKKQMTLAQFQQFRKQQGKELFKEFHASCETLKKTPEKLQKSPFYSPLKDDVSIAHIAADTRSKGIRRRLFTAEGSSQVDNEVKNDVVEPKNDESPRERSPSPDYSPLPPHKHRLNLPHTPPRSESLPSPLIESSSGLTVLPAVEIRSPVKTPAKRSVDDKVLSPWKRTSLFSPSKGHLCQNLRTASDVYTEAIQRQVREEKSQPAVQSPVKGIKRKADDFGEMVEKRLQRFREDCEKLAKHRVGLVTSLGDNVGLPSTPAYQRTEIVDLATEKVKPEKLPLPSKFRELEEIFQRIDLTASIYAGREICCFEKLQSTFTLASRNALTESDLGRILFFSPELFTVRAEKIISENACPVLKSKDKNREHHVLYVRDHQKKLEESPEDSIISVKMSPLERVKRQEFLHQKMLEFLRCCHKDFLAKLPAPIVLTEEQERKINCWHREFKLEDVELPPPVALPPFSRPDRGLSSDQVFALVPSLASRVQPLFSPKNSDNNMEKSNGLLMPKQSSAAVEKLLKDPIFMKMNQKARDRIMENTLRKEMDSIIRDPVKLRRKALMGKMEIIANIVLGVFVANNSVSERKAKEAIETSLKGRFSRAELNEHFELFLEIFAEGGWITKRTYCNNDWYLERNSAMGLPHLINIVQNEMEKLKNV